MPERGEAHCRKATHMCRAEWSVTSSVFTAHVTLTVNFLDLHILLKQLLNSLLRTVNFRLINHLKKIPESYHISLETPLSSRAFRKKFDKKGGERQL